MLMRGVIVVSAGHVGGTRDPGIVSSAADVLWMSVVLGRVELVQCVSICLAHGGEGVSG